LADMNLGDTVVAFRGHPKIARRTRNERSTSVIRITFWAVSIRSIAARSAPIDIGRNGHPVPTLPWPRRVSRSAKNLPRYRAGNRILQSVAQEFGTGNLYQLGVSEATVNAHVKHIREKLNASDRTHAVTTALRRGIVRR